jgi:2,5-diamino-6-(ribosylamino)-4(3H)-pyrimidinone 5'-phosphate reductase
MCYEPAFFVFARNALQCVLIPSKAMTIMLPHVTLYNEISLDGKIAGFEGDIGRYYTRSFRWHADAILVGGRTALSFGPPEPEAERVAVLPLPPKEPVYPGFEDLVYEPRPLIVIPDSRGQVLNWQAIHAQPWYRDPVALVSRATPPDYLAYLQRRHVATIVAGDDHVDLVAAFETLAARFGVRSILADCGGTLNGALLQAGLVDEIALILNPSLVGDLNIQIVYRPLDTPAGPIQLRLAEVERLDDGAVWLRYEVVK